MKYLFLDTNILIHYQCFEDIPWNSVLETADDITVVICETVVAEIDIVIVSQGSSELLCGVQTLSV